MLFTQVVCQPFIQSVTKSNVCSVVDTEKETQESADTCKKLKAVNAVCLN